MYQNQNSQEGELDLGELLSALWANKLLITLIISLSVFLSGYYALNTEKNSPLAQYLKSLKAIVVIALNFQRNGRSSLYRRPRIKC